VYTCTRPCTSRVHDRERTAYIRPVHGHERGRVHVYKTRTRPLHGRVRAVNTAEYTAIMPCTRPSTVIKLQGGVRVVCTARVHEYMACAQPCTRLSRVHGCVHGPCTGVRGPYTAVHVRYSRVRAVSTTVNTAVYGPCRRPCTRLCTRPCTSRVHKLASYTTVPPPCTRCLLAVYTAVTPRCTVRGR